MRKVTHLISATAPLVVVCAVIERVRISDQDNLKNPPFEKKSKSFLRWILRVSFLTKNLQNTQFNRWNFLTWVKSEIFLVRYSRTIQKCMDETLARLQVSRQLNNLWSLFAEYRRWAIDLLTCDYVCLWIGKRPTTLSILRRIREEHGIRGWFTGVVPRVGKVAPACAIMVATFEYGKAFFQRYNAERFNRTL